MSQEDGIYEIPKRSRNLAACIGCGLLREYDDWKDLGCPNCGWTSDDYKTWVSSSFNGVLALFKPETSWCSSWLKYNHNIKGLYCIDNLGEVTDEIVEFLKTHDRPLPEWVERYTLTEQRTEN